MWVGVGECSVGVCRGECDVGMCRGSVMWVGVGVV